VNILLANGGPGDIAPAIAVAERLEQHRYTSIINNKKVDETFSKKYSQFSVIKTATMPLNFSSIAFSKFIFSQFSPFRFVLGFLKKIKLISLFLLVSLFPSPSY
jgi:UDP-N-acetylglucosamine:LPS N-acetylglucosamine transferase